ncbi:substrate-binding periplasmic protein [Maridesulfovibrio sp.]|uniref:substrate-binding periplasmic protein n=1 Tax=Maridesulfovibrio sp. TaxID=2795000 RepID=UPI0039EE568B
MIKKYPATRIIRNKKIADNNLKIGYINSVHLFNITYNYSDLRQRMNTNFLKTILIFCTLLAFTCAEANAGQTDTQHIKIIFGYKFPPFYTVTSKNEPSKSLRGLFIDMLENFQKQYSNYKLEYRCLPRARIGKQINNGEADAFALTSPMFTSQETKSRYNISLPMWTIEDHLLVRRDSTLTTSDLEHMTGRTIAVLHGNSYGPLDEYLSNGIIKTHPVYSTKLVLELLYNKRVDAAICNKTTLPYLLKESSHTMDDFRMLEKPLYAYKLHLLVNRKNSTFLDDFNNFLKNNPLPGVPPGVPPVK